MRPASGRWEAALSENGWDRRRWCRWTEVVELGARVGGDRVAEAVEPGARVEVLPVRRQLRQRGLVGVAHHDEAEVRFPGQKLTGPLMLARGRVPQLPGVHGVIAQVRTQGIHHPQADLGMN